MTINALSPPDLVEYDRSSMIFHGFISSPWLGGTNIEVRNSSVEACGHAICQRRGSDRALYAISTAIKHCLGGNPRYIQAELTDHQFKTKSAKMVSPSVLMILHSM